MTQKQSQIVKINIYNERKAQRRTSAKAKPMASHLGSVAFNNRDTINSEIARNYLRQIENPFDQKRYINNLLDTQITPKLNYFGARFLQSADNRYALKSNLYQDDAGNFADNNPRFESQRLMQSVYPDEEVGISPIRASQPNTGIFEDDQEEDNYSNYSRPSYVSSANNPMFPLQDDTEEDKYISLDLSRDLLEYIDNAYNGEQRRTNVKDRKLYQVLANAPEEEVAKLKIDFIRRQNVKILKANGLL